jgi:hypothetical protein
VNVQKRNHLAHVCGRSNEAISISPEFEKSGSLQEEANINYIATKNII